jgi:hypothetical protein
MSLLRSSRSALRKLRNLRKSPAKDDPRDVDLQQDVSTQRNVETQQDELCNVCKDIEIKDFFLDRPDRHGYPPQRDIPTLPYVFNLDYLDVMVQNKHCPLCRLVIKAVERGWTARPSTYLRNIFSDSTRPRCLLKSCEATTADDPVRSVELNILDGDRVLVIAGPDKRQLFQMELRLLADDAHILELDELGNGRKIEQVCQVEMMKIWYRKCEAEHRDNCSSPRIVSEQPLDMRVIDVDKMLVTSAPKSCKYVALSYVWGDLESPIKLHKDNLKSWGINGSLSALKLPKTIADAIKLARDLKEHFLWVDTLCIVQDADDEDKARQIRQMDRIYGLASLVIVAAGGGDAEAGLIGYQDNPREERQHIETIQGLRIIVSSPPLRHTLQHSKWNTRGWTFQEWQLARKALVFTDEQVFYICSSTSFCEDLALEKVNPHKPMQLILGNCEASTLRHYLPSKYMPLTVNSGLRDYRHVVNEYTHRELKHDSDILKAVSGLLNQLHLASGNRFVCGMSVGLFHESLFWVPSGPLKRRDYAESGLQYPSWSWAGWKGAVRYAGWPWAEESWVKEWTVVSADGTRSVLGKPLSEPQNDHIMMGVTSFTGSRTEGESLRIGDGRLKPNHLEPCRLEFQASVAILQVSGTVLNDIAGKADALLDLRGGWIGVVLFDKPRSHMERIRQDSGSFRRFAVMAISQSISAINEIHLPGYITLPQDSQWLNVMVLEEVNGVSYRLGVGQVSKIGWGWAESVIRRVVLG